MILVTGAAGFIGSSLVKHLNGKGRDDIVICDRIRDNRWQNIADLNFYEYIDADYLFTAIKNRTFETIVHLGADSNSTTQDFHWCYRYNTCFTGELWHHAYRKGSDFIYASSASTYGLGENGFSDDHDLIHTLRPKSEIGRAHV